MKTSALHVFVSVVLLSLLAASTSVAQPAPPRPGLPPLPPPPKPLTDIFRQLLNATPAKVDAWIETRPERSQSVLRNKLEEYRQLDPAERERKLDALDFRWYLKVLLEMEEEAQTKWISNIPEKHRTSIVERLRSWRLLSPALRQQLLANGQAAVMLSRLRIEPSLPGSTNSGTPTRSMTPPPIPKIENAISTWNSWSQSQQNQVAKRLLGNENAQFANLPPEQRARCIKAFRRYVELTRSERTKFLQDAARWRKMRENDREVWRALINPIVPPLPPNSVAPPPMPN